MPKTKKEKNWKKDILILLSHVHIELYWLKIVISKSFSCYLHIFNESIDILTLIIIHYWDFEWGNLIFFISLCWESQVDWWVFIVIISFSRGVFFVIILIIFNHLWIIINSLFLSHQSFAYLCQLFWLWQELMIFLFYYPWRMKSFHLCSESQFDYLFWILIYQCHSRFALLLFVFQIWMCLKSIHHQ